MLLIGALMGRGTPKLVDIIGANVSGTSSSPDDATARYTCASDGDEYTDVSGDTPDNINTWLIYGTADEYEIAYTATGDTGSLDGTYAADGTYYGCDLDPFWEITDTSGAGGDVSVTGTLSIRLVSNSIELDTATLILTAEEIL